MEELKDLQQFVDNLKRGIIPIEKLITIKTYLPIKDKIKFVQNYNNILQEHIKDYEGLEHIVAFIFFNLCVMKEYTNLKIDLTYEEFDILQEYDLISKITEKIGTDYELLMQFIK